MAYARGLQGNSPPGGQQAAFHIVDLTGAEEEEDDEEEDGAARNLAVLREALAAIRAVLERIGQDRVAPGQNERGVGGSAPGGE